MGVKGIRKLETEMQIESPILFRKTPDNTKHKELCEKGGKWLKKHSQNILIPNCSIVAVELFTQIEPEIPDIIGWTSWCSIMIEVKVQRSDFLQDYKKPFRNVCENGVGEFRYYLCPENMINENEIPDNWGLLYETNSGIKIIKKAEKQCTNLLAERNMLTSIIRKNK